MLSHPHVFFKKHGLTPREQQLFVTDEIYKNWGKYRYFALNLGTGVGKTFIATAIADSLNSSYILTSTIQLQKQYEDSWDEIVNLKGRSNYECALNSAFKVDAAPCALKRDLLKQCKAACRCHYYNQKDLALRSKAMITNPVFMMYSAHCGFASESTEWTRRDALIIDEAHNIESHLVSFAESEIDIDRLQKTYDVDLNSITLTQDPVHNYSAIALLRAKLMSKATEYAAILQKEMSKKKVDEENLGSWASTLSKVVGDKVDVISKKAYQLDKAIQPLNVFFNTSKDLNEACSRWIFAKTPYKNALKLSPLCADFIFEDYLGKLAEKFVFMSATLPPKAQLCRELGIDESECLYISIDSPFPPEESPVVILESIKLSKDSYDENIKKLGPIIDAILDEHPNQCGIVHSVTYDLQQKIFSSVSAKNRARLVCRDAELLTSGIQGRKITNAELIAHHSEKVASVLLSPSMMEGVDLYDDLSEFQIIVKLPWLNLGDARTKRKTEIDGDWYASKMWSAFLQCCGRSTRHEKDSSTTYVLDANFKFFWKKWRHNLPAQFNARLTEIK